MDKNRIVAVGLLTEHDLNLLGPAFTRAYPLDDAPCFTQLLKAIDEAEREAMIRANTHGGTPQG